MIKESMIYILHPAKLVSSLFSEIRFIYTFILSAFLGNLQRRKYRKLKSFCIFVGYPRSGHSLVAALLDAHPNMVMAMEMDALWYLKKGFKRFQLFYLLKRYAYYFQKIRNNIWTGYSYSIQGSWQGRHQLIEIIGDKQGGRTSLRIKEDPAILDKLQRTVKVPLKIIHIVRNPFDMITTAVFRKHERENLPQPVSSDLLPFIQSFLQRADTIAELKSNPKYKLLDIHHENLLQNPKYELQVLLDFLELKPTDGYLESCASIINPTLNLSRNRIEWPEQLISYVEMEFKKYPFFSHYTFSS